MAILTQDFDDENAAQMTYLKKIVDSYRKVDMENISELKLDYNKNVIKKGDTIYIDSYSDKQCKPVWKLNGKEVNCLINSYPKEWLINEIERDELMKYDVAELGSVEPWWKLILGNKALLPLLWSMFPEHPNLIPSFYD